MTEIDDLSDLSETVGPNKEMYSIDHGIPLSPPAKRGLSKRRPWDDMEIGDSFFVPGGTMNLEYVCITAAEHHRPGKKFTHRAVPGGVRVWRVCDSLPPQGRRRGK